MGQFSVTIYGATGSVLNDIQHVPGFSDFKDEVTRSALQLDNIRNLFMNVANDIKLDLGEPASGNSIPICLTSAPLGQI